MNVVLDPGTYIVAVSGGVDSVVLFELLRHQTDLQLIVAHFDHGIREESYKDAEFVADLAQKYELPFELERAELGAGASEENARTARYDFLERLSVQYNNAPIVLAHHQDDVLETAIHNIIRGTNRRGVTSLRSTDHLVRPLLSQPKQALIDYALQQNLSWREDTTNHDQRYTRNYIRHRLLVRIDTDARQQLLSLIATASAINDELDDGLDQLLDAHSTASAIERGWFCTLDHALSKEIVAAWLRQRELRDYNARDLERLTIAIKTTTPGKKLDIMRNYYFLVGQHDVQLQLKK